MRSLSSIREQNSAPGVGDKLGRNNGDPIFLNAQHESEKRIRAFVSAAWCRGPMDRHIFVRDEA